MVNKKVVVICSIIAIIVVAIIVAIQIKIFNTQEYEDDSQLVTEEENYSEQDGSEEEYDDGENTANENASTAQTQNSVNLEQYETDYHGEEETSSNTSTTSGESTEEQALSLVKEDWGEDDSVYYTVDNQSGNIYNISVRSKSTTASLAEYEVDMSTGAIIEK